MNLVPLIIVLILGNAYNSQLSQEDIIKFCPNERSICIQKALKVSANLYLIFYSNL